MGKSWKGLKRRIIHRVGWKIARTLYWVDRYWPSPSNLGTRIIEWMERKRCCCERHGLYEVENKKEN